MGHKLSKAVMPVNGNKSTNARYTLYTLKNVKIKKSASPPMVIHAKYYDTFLGKFVGLMFSQELKQDAGIVLVEKNESRLNTSIHMLFMNYDITVLWLDNQRIIVDKVLAKKWFPAYIPKKPARYVVELHASRFHDFSIGERLSMQDEPW